MSESRPPLSMASLFVVGLVCLMFWPQPAVADTMTTYTINFTTTSGIAPTSASYTWDVPPGSVTGYFTSFQVVWDGVTFDMTTSANEPFSGNAGLCEAYGSSGGLAIVTETLPGPPNCFFQYSWDAFVRSSAGTTTVFFNLDADNVVGGNYVGTDAIQGQVNLDPSLTDSGTGTWSVTPSSLPEPDSLHLVGAGLLALGLALRRRRLA